MRIHTIQSGESISNIAKEYEVSDEIIRRVNELEDKEGCPGEDLLIQIPTRSYTTIYGDTLDRIALRFGVRKGDLYSLNPWLNGSPLTVGQTLTLKTGETKLGMSVANGYFYQGCTREQLTRAMPYLTYITFAAAKADERSIHKSFDCSKEVQICEDNQKIPLIRVFDCYTERYKKAGNYQNFAEELISLATEGGYKGIVLDACPLYDSAEEFSAFLMILRKLMIGCDLILITEINEKSPLEFSEYADGSVFYYPTYAMENPLSFEGGERKVLSDFACQGESAKVFVDLPSLAMNERGFTSINEAIDLARRRGCEIETNESTLLSHFRDRKQGEYRFTSMSGIKSLLELLNEFSYMGICFDIMRTPLSHLMMYNSMFKTSYYTNVRSPEGCSRGVEG